MNLGIIHEEYHSRAFAAQGGMFEMAQIWVNLPSLNKMQSPEYQPIKASEITRVDLPNEAGFVNLIAGRFDSTAVGPAKTYSPMNMWDVHLNMVEGGEGQRVEFSLDIGHNAMIFVRKGGIMLCEQNEVLPFSRIALLSVEGEKITMQALEPDTKVLLLSGVPLNEPIAARGPFCMNTETELRQAMLDYQQGRMG